MKKNMLKVLLFTCIFILTSSKYIYVKGVEKGQVSQNINAEARTNDNNKYAVVYNENLCNSNEEVLFSFKTKDTNKVLSVCISKEEPTYIVYRFGTKDNIELEFPKDKNGSWSKFTYSYYLRGGGKENAGLDLNYLYFKNGNYTYKIYEQYSAEEEMNYIGVKIIETSTKKEFYIEGINSSRMGSLIYLRDNSKIKIDGE